MLDEFLEAFAQKRQLRVERDRAFEIGGVKLIHRPAVAPEIPLLYQEVTDAMARWGEEVNRLLESANGSTPELPAQPYTEAELIQVYNDFVLACLDPSCHDGWAALRNPDVENPLLGEDIYQLAIYLLGKTTALPTEGPPASSDTRPATSTMSPGSSPSRARKRKTSAPS